VFVHGRTEGQTWVSGGINWAKAGRHFKLETCPKHEDEEDCFIWKEMDPTHWYPIKLFFKLHSSICLQTEFHLKLIGLKQCRSLTESANSKTKLEICVALFQILQQLYNLV
jgi:hypothetical protein